MKVKVRRGMRVKERGEVCSVKNGGKRGKGRDVGKGEKDKMLTTARTGDKQMINKCLKNIIEC